MASTLPWPIAVEPSARSSPISDAAGIVERAAPASAGSWLKPYCSAVLTSLWAPISAPIGAKTELQECAKAVLSEPPQDSPLAFSSRTPSRVAAVSTGYSFDGFASPDSSPAVSVMILNTDPGGCGAEYAIPASASTSPSFGRITATPPSRPASAVTAARWTSGSIVVRTAWPASGRDVREHPVAGEQAAARRPGELGVELSLEPGQADGGAVGDAAALELGGALGRRGADASGDLRRQRAEVGEPVLALGERRAVAREDRGARRQLGPAAQPLAAAQAGLDEVALPGDRGAVVLLDDRQGELPAQRAEDPRPHRHGHADAAVDGLGRLPGDHTVERARPGGVAVGGGEALQRDALLGLRRQQRVHGRVVAATPGIREALGGVLARVLAGGADRDPDGERGHRGEHERREPGRHATTPAGTAAGRRRGGGPGSRACGRGHARRTL